LVSRDLTAACDPPHPHPCMRPSESSGILSSPPLSAHPFVRSQETIPSSRPGDRQSGASGTTAMLPPYQVLLTWRSSVDRAMLGQDDQRRACQRWRRSSRHNLVFGGSLRIRTMMQSCASAARLRGGGPILSLGMEGHWAGRVTATSDHLGVASRRSG